MKNMNEKKKNTSLIAIIVVVVVLAIVGVVGFQFRELIFPDFFSEEGEDNAGKEESVEKKNKKTGYDLNSYMVFEFEGYDYAGSVKVSFDKKNFLIDYEDKLEKKTKKMDIEIDEYVDDVIIPNLTYSIDKSNGLSNGDKVHLTWKLDKEKVQEKYDIILNVEDFDVEVKGLKEPEEFDPFEGVDMVFYGKAPFGKASLIGGDNNLVYIFDKEGLKNGDVITVEIDYRGLELKEFVAAYHKNPIVTKKDFTVSGLPEIITNADEVPEEVINLLNDKMQKTAMADFTVKREEELVSMELLGYFFMLNNKESGYHDNGISLVYRNQVKVVPDGTDITAYLYYYSVVTFFDIEKDEQGQVVVDSAVYEIPDVEILKYVRVLLSEENEYSYKGFDSIEEIQKSYIAKYESDYDVSYKELKQDNIQLIDNIDQIDDEFIIDAANYGAAAYQMYINTLGNDEKLTEISYIGHYFAKSKYDEKNVLILLYQLELYENGYYAKGNCNLYFTIRWDNIGKDENLLEYEKYNNKISEIYKSKLNYDILFGYETYEDMYNKEVLNLTSDYNVEMFMKE